MSLHNPPRGGAPVGHLGELATVEALAVIYLRLWCEGGAERELAVAGLGRAPGPRGGALAIDALDAMADLIARHGRRPLMRHAVGCKCLGADEACFANFIGAASECAREDALLLATLMVRPDMAPSLLALAETFGLVLRQLAGASDRQTHARTTLH